MCPSVRPQNWAPVPALPCPGLRSRGYQRPGVGSSPCLGARESVRAAARPLQRLPLLDTCGASSGWVEGMASELQTADQRPSHPDGRNLPTAASSFDFCVHPSSFLSQRGPASGAGKPACPQPAFRELVRRGPAGTLAVCPDQGCGGGPAAFGWGCAWLSSCGPVCPPPTWVWGACSRRLVTWLPEVPEHAQWLQSMARQACSRVTTRLFPACR